jgi:hypothetical protein
MLKFVYAGQQNKNTEYLLDNNNEIGLEINAGRKLYSCHLVRMTTEAPNNGNR